MCRGVIIKKRNFYFNSMFHGMAGSANRASRSSLHEALVSGGLFAGALGGGVAYQHAGIETVYLLSAAVVMAGVVAQAAIGLWVRRVEGPFPRRSAR